MRKLLPGLAGSFLWVCTIASATGYQPAYDTVKRVLVDMFDAGIFWTDNDRFDPMEIGLRLHPCSSAGGGFAVTKEDMLYQQLATRVLLAERGLKETDYPESLWRPDLDAFERRILGRGADALNEWGWLVLHSEDLTEFYAIIDGLDAHRASHAGRLPEVMMGEGCGDGGIQAELRTEPPGGRIWLLTEYDFRICEAMGIDPMDLESCRWREETGRNISVLAGNYRIYVRWADDREAWSRQSFLDSADDEFISITIRP